MPPEAGTHERRLRDDAVVDRQVGLGVEGVEAGLRELGQHGPSTVTGEAKLPLVTTRGTWPASRPAQCSATERTA